MCLAELQGWGVSERSAPSPAPAPRGPPLQTEQAVREWEVLGGGWGQGV